MEKRFNNQQAGQGIIEYVGALLVVVAAISTLISGLQTDSWMLDLFRGLFNLPGQVLMDQVIMHL